MFSPITARRTLGCIVLSLLAAACGKSPSEPSNLEPSPSIPILGLVLEDDLGQATREQRGTVQGQILVLTEETIGLRIRIVTPAGFVEPRTPPYDLDVTVENGDPAALEAAILPDSSPAAVRLRGRRAEIVPVGFTIREDGRAIYTSAAIPIQVEAAPEISGFRLFDGTELVHTRLGGETSGPLALREGQRIDTMQVVFLDPEGQPLDRQHLGRGAHVVLEDAPPFLVEFELEVDGPFSFEAAATEPGETQISLDLVRQDGVFYRSPVSIDVRRIGPP
jgi:hypothetical protein